MIEKLDGMTKDLVKENVEKLKELFPSIVKEDKIDFEELELLLGEDINRSKEQYSFVWNGKTEATKLAQKRSTGTLRPCIEESKDWDTTKNIYIEGDNLEVLKLLQTSYNGRIKMIYIDPPYNTGHDFVYKDNFEDNLANYKEITGQAQKSNADTDGRYHTNWLNMMYPRLRLARTLLSDDGVIFISIDDNEIVNLRNICNDIFGEDNFVGQITIAANPRGRDYGGVAKMHDYLLVYKRKEGVELNLIEDKEGSFTMYDEFGGFELRELRNRNIKFNIDNRPNLCYPFYVNPNNIDENGLYEISLQKESGFIEVMPAKSQNVQTVWRWGKEKSQSNLNINIKAKKMKEDNRYMIVEKYREDKKMARSIWQDKDVNTEKGTLLVKDLFERKVFDYPKPIEFIERTLQMGSSTDDDDIVLDFFSGSASTAHAVMQLNAKDGGNRKFICVQLPEKTEEYSEAYKAGYKNICEIGKERIRRAGENIKNDRNIKIGLNKTQLMQRNIKEDGSFEDKFATKVEVPNEEYLDNLDIGFKVFKLDTSNLKKWNNDPTKDANEVAKRIQLSLDYLENDRNELDLVYEIMLKYGLDLTLPITKSSNEKAYIVNGEEYKLLICSEMNLTLDDIESFANESVGTYLFADRCFADDNLLINTQEILKSRNKEMRLF